MIYTAAYCASKHAVVGMTTALAAEYAAQGVSLLRVEGRLGKTEVENRAFDSLTGEIIVNTDSMEYSERA